MPLFLPPFEEAASPQQLAKFEHN